MSYDTKQLTPKNTEATSSAAKHAVPPFRVSHRLHVALCDYIYPDFFSSKRVPGKTLQLQAQKKLALARKQLEPTTFADIPPYLEPLWTGYEHGLARVEFDRKVAEIAEAYQGCAKVCFTRDALRWMVTVDALNSDVREIAWLMRCQEANALKYLHALEEIAAGQKPKPYVPCLIAAE